MAKKVRCPICASTEVQVEFPSKYHYENVGLPDVVLIGRGVSITHCQNCQNMTTHVNDEQQLLQVIGLIPLLGPPGMSGKELRYLRTLYGMTQTALAKALGLPRRETIAEWEAKGRIFANPAAEIAPRLVLLNLFKIHVFESDHCFLADIHWQGYDTFARSVVDRIQDMLIKKKSSRRLSLRRRSKKREWSADIITV